MSIMWCVFSARITPDWRSISSSVRRGARVERTAWPGGTTWPERPAVTTTTGLTDARRRAMRENLRGLPIDSRYRQTTCVAASSCQYCMRSLPDTSARWPADRNDDTPSPRRAVVASSVTAMGADWLNRPTTPGSGRSSASVAAIAGRSRASPVRSRP